MNERKKRGVIYVSGCVYIFPLSLYHHSLHWKVNRRLLGVELVKVSISCCILERLRHSVTHSCVTSTTYYLHLNTKLNSLFQFRLFQLRLFWDAQQHFHGMSILFVLSIHCIYQTNCCNEMISTFVSYVQ